MSENAVTRPSNRQPDAIAVRADPKTQNFTRRLLMKRRAISRVLVFGAATAAASLLTFANAIQFLLDSSRHQFLPANQRNLHNRRLHPRGHRRSRALRTHRDYYIFLKYKVTRRVPALFRYHHSVWAFRLKTYPRRLSSRNLPRFSILKTLPAPNLRRFLLRHSDRLGCLSQYPPITLKHDRLPILKCCQSRLAKLAIVTPSYNQAHFLEETIRSVLDNGYPSLEYAVVDGDHTTGLR